MICHEKQRPHRPGTLSSERRKRRPQHPGPPHPPPSQLSLAGVQEPVPGEGGAVDTVRGRAFSPALCSVAQPEGT